MNIQKESFLQYCVGSAATLGLPLTVLDTLEQALTTNDAILPKILWLNGAQCTECQSSLTNFFSESGQTAGSDLLVDTIDLPANPELIDTAGEQTVQLLLDTTENSYILVVDGCIPTTLNGPSGMAWLDQVNQVTALEALQMLAENAQAVLTIGSCVTSGAKPSADPKPTDTVSINTLAGVATVNIPECPGHPDWIIWAIAHLISGETPQRDDHDRPVELYGTANRPILQQNNQNKTCESKQQISPKDPLQFTNVVLDTTTPRLKVEGRGTAGTVVNIYNADSGALLAAVPVNKAGRWKLQQNPSPLPSRLLSKSGNETIFSVVARSPLTSH